MKVGPVNAAGSSGASAMVASARKLEEEEDTFIRKFQFFSFSLSFIIFFIKI